MYEAFYGFKEKPFSMLPDPGFLYLSKQHQAALTLLEYGLLNHVGFCVISGEAGAGKTTILRALLERIEDDVTVGLITNTHQSFGGLLDWVLSAFDLHKPNLTHVEMHQVFMDYLIEEYANGRTVLLIVDEAQNMKPDALEELRMLSNVNSAKDQLMQVVLSGQPALKETLRMPELMQFAQRIAVDYHLDSLNLEETCGYIQHRLITAGAKKDVFTPAACERIHNYSGGTPRLINLLCETVLVYGFADQQDLIDVGLVDEMVLERMKDSVVPIVNRDIAKKSNKKESAELEKNFPHIIPEEDLDAGDNDQEAEDEAAIEVQKIIKGYSRSDMADGTEAAVAEKKEVKTVAKKQGGKKDKEGSSNRGRAAAVSNKSTASENNSSSQVGSASASISKDSSSTLPPTEDAQQAGEAGSESRKQLIQYAIKAGAVGLVLIVLAFMLNGGDEPAETAEVKEVSAEVQVQREQESKRLRQLQIEAETLKKERDAAVAEAEEERQAKSAAEKLAAEKATAVAAAAELKRKANEKKKLAAAKKRERVAKQAEEKAKAEAKVAKQKALELEKERLYMQTQLDEQRRLKEQEAARRRVLEFEEEARRQLVIEAAEQEAAVAAEVAASKAKKSVDCSGPTARFKASCRR